MIKPAQTIIIGFETSRYDTGATVDADDPPVGVLVLNGADLLDTVTIANKAIGSYKAAFDIPSDSIDGDTFEVRVEATVNSIAGKATIWRDTVDTTLAAIKSDTGAIKGVTDKVDTLIEVIP